MEIKTIITLIVIGIAILGFVFFLSSRKIKKMKQQISLLTAETNKLNEDILAKTEEKNNLEKDVALSKNTKLELDLQIDTEQNLIKNCIIEKDGLLNSINDLKNQAQTAADIFYQQTMDLANFRIEQDIDLEEKRYNEAIKAYQDEYVQVLEDLNDDFKAQIEKHRIEMSQVTAAKDEAEIQLYDIKNKIAIAIESKKIAEQNGLEKNYYRCVISDADIAEIERLRSIEPYFRNSRPICKIIWESYYKDSFSALLARILPDKGTVSGIYKITNLTNEKVYVGQSVNLAERLRTHVKAGIGIDPPGLKLYQDMKKIGVENFSFEILEKCPQAELNVKEKYWIDFYHCQDFGYNMTKGGSQKIVN